MILSLHKFSKRISNRVCAIFYRLSFYSFGIGSTIELPFRSDGESQIKIGKKVYIGADSWMSVYQTSLGLNNKPVIEIGDFTSISGHCTITASKSVCIGNSVLIARYVYISDHSHQYGDLNIPIKDQGITEPRAVFICDGAWIGQGAVICPGVKIGKNSVVAANALVRYDVPDYCVVAGSPAKIIKRFGPVV